MSDRLQDQFFGHQHVTEINPPAGWRMLDWRELWAYRELMSRMVSTDSNSR